MLTCCCPAFLLLQSKAGRPGCLVGGFWRQGEGRRPRGSQAAPPTVLRGGLPFTLGTFIITGRFQMKLETQGLSNLLTVLQPVTGPRTEPEGLTPGPTSLCGFPKADN